VKKCAASCKLSIFYKHENMVNSKTLLSRYF
jgi:hypothetical protein